MKDLANEMQWGSSHRVDDGSSGANGTGVDFRDCGPDVTVIVNAGPSFTGTLDVSLEESTDNSTWTAIASSSITQMTAAGIQVKTIFNRGKRYVRAVSVIGGGTPAIDYQVILGAVKTSY